ncbi:hypothetical protein PILCRDRAFT_724139 [Piloderma croceum F 1598]|uniref:Uncharacterized protein n=1 Tax=Piloderma croceum (strain F 1598) TaxID=765440 RepID=A0A0C3F0Z8_PILCF|nr:hypothetical protein PILCRDRAFT_724139 [Piloderma croceum F 1598]
MIGGVPTAFDFNKFVIGVCDHVITTTGPEDLVLQSNPNPLNNDAHVFTLVVGTHRYATFDLSCSASPHSRIFVDEQPCDHPNPDDCPNESKLNGAFAIQPELQSHAE